MIDSEQPGLIVAPAVFVGLDLVRVAQGQPDVIEPVYQAVLADLVDIEPVALRAIGRRNNLLAQIDHQLKTGKRRRIMKQPVDF